MLEINVEIALKCTEGYGLTPLTYGNIYILLI